MEFRLTYEGTLLGASKTDTRPEHKHDIRKAFHPQLKRLWQITPHLDTVADAPQSTDLVINGGDAGGSRFSRIQALANKFVCCNYRFVPLVTRNLSLICGVDVLFLRPDHPGGLIRSGDIDNRLKTLFDALRMPQVGELGNWAMPTEEEDPFFCLLENDDLITQLSVETDTLLQPIRPERPNANDARLTITVRLRPAPLSWGNIHFG
jgi:hypothetical protein